MSLPASRDEGTSGCRRLRSDVVTISARAAPDLRCGRIGPRSTTRIDTRPGIEVGHRLRHAAIGYGGDVEAGRMLEYLQHRQSHAVGDGIGQLAGIGLGIGDQLLKPTSPAPMS